MSYRYRVEYVETGNVVEPSGWNANQAELASEFNGGLDRDNFGLGAISQAMLADNACHEFDRQVMSSSTAVTLSAETTDWQTILESTGITSALDCIAVIEWSGEWEWSGAASYAAGTNTEDALELRLTVDGETVCQTGPIGDQRVYDATYLVGAALLAPGAHTITLQGRIAERNFDGLSVNDRATNAPTFNDGEMLIVVRKR